MEPEKQMEVKEEDGREEKDEGNRGRMKIMYRRWRKIRRERLL